MSMIDKKSDVNFSNVSFNFDYLFFDVFQRYQYQ